MADEQKSNQDQPFPYQAPPRAGMELEAPSGQWYRLESYLSGDQTATIWRAILLDDPATVLPVRVTANPQGGTAMQILPDSELFMIILKEIGALRWEVAALLGHEQPQLRSEAERRLIQGAMPPGSVDEGPKSASSAATRESEAKAGQARPADKSPEDKLASSATAAAPEAVKDKSAADGAAVEAGAQQKPEAPATAAESAAEPVKTGEDELREKTAADSKSIEEKEGAASPQPQATGEGQEEASTEAQSITEASELSDTVSAEIEAANKEGFITELSEEERRATIEASQQSAKALLTESADLSQIQEAFKKLSEAKSLGEGLADRDQLLEEIEAIQSSYQADQLEDTIELCQAEFSQAFRAIRSEHSPERRDRLLSQMQQTIQTMISMEGIFSDAHRTELENMQHNYEELSERY